jgi:hypothetical protein
MFSLNNTLGSTVRNNLAFWTTNLFEARRPRLH